LKAKDLLPLLSANLDPEHDVRCIEETEEAITVNMHGGPDSVTCIGKVRIIPKPIKEEHAELDQDVVAS
jgi:hypothetical protein